MLNELGVDALKKAKAELEEAIQVQLNKVAILRKRHDALTMALEVLRSSDSELMTAMPDLSKVGNHKRPSLSKINEDEIEGAIIRVLPGNKLTKRDLMEVLNGQGMLYSMSALDRVLKTSPHIQRVGERQRTAYVMVKSEG